MSLALGAWLPGVQREVLDRDGVANKSECFADHKLWDSGC